jgi:type IV pilus assembly protein PilA
VRTRNDGFEKEESQVLQLMRRRLQGEREGGFTLIELMVVVLIIAILIAIAIPTFLGARARAQDRAAQSNLRNALTAEKTYYTDKQAYTVTPSDMTSIEPSLSFTATVAPALNTVSMVKSTTTIADDTITLGTKSASGTCFYIKDVATGSTSQAAGTFYGTDSDGTCADTAATAATLGKW